MACGAAERRPARALRLVPTTVPLRDVVSDAIADVAPLAARRKIHVIAAHSGRPLVRAGERELARVVSNLLINSVAASSRHTAAAWTSATPTAAADSKYASPRAPHLTRHENVFDLRDLRRRKGRVEVARDAQRLPRVAPLTTKVGVRGHGRRAKGQVSDRANV
jgi:signal transduction histidine kinase